MIAKEKAAKKSKKEKVEVIEKEECDDCKDLPEGEVAEGHDHQTGGEDAPAEELQEDIIEEEIEESMPADRRDPRFSAFKVKSIVVQNGLRLLSVEIMKTFENIHLDYTVEMSTDVDTLDWRIEEKKKAKQAYENQNQMEAFDEFKKRDLEEYDTMIGNLMDERANRIAQSPKLSFRGIVNGFKKKANSTDLVFLIPGEMVGPLADQYNFMDNYKMELIKNLSND